MDGRSYTGSDATRSARTAARHTIPVTHLASDPSSASIDVAAVARSRAVSLTAGTASASAGVLFLLLGQRLRRRRANRSRVP